MTAKEYCIAFCEGYFCAQLGEKLNNGKVTEHTLDLAKETAQTCMEQQIAYSAFDEKQKQEMKENLHYRATPLPRLSWLLFRELQRARV